jgi:DNA-binding XRE family transcriptional regulator
MDWHRAATAVAQRRAELKLSQRKAAELADISPTTWGVLETHATAVNQTTAAAMSRALGWSASSIVDIAQGGRPTVEAPPTDTFAARASAALREQIIEIVDGMAHPALWGTAVAVVWVKGRDEYGPNVGEVMEQGVSPTWQELIPSLDELMLFPPDVGEMEGIILGQWRAARQRWDAAVQEALASGVELGHLAAGRDHRQIPGMPAPSAYGIVKGVPGSGIPLRRLPIDEAIAEDPVEDHALAAASGEDPTHIPDTPTVNRPSPEIEPDPYA